MIDYYDLYLALRTPQRSGLLAWSALPDAPVLSDERPRRPTGRLRRGTAWTLVGLAKRLDPLVAVARSVDTAVGRGGSLSA